MPQTQKSSCADEAGHLVPVIDRNRCEAKGDCVEVCPYDVFEIRVLGREERSALSLLGRLKAFAHGHKQAFAVRAERCRACALCVQACPERAIKLRAEQTES
jgi:4Fe-4S ferredoxin